MSIYSNTKQKSPNKNKIRKYITYQDLKVYNVNMQIWLGKWAKKMVRIFKEHATNVNNLQVIDKCPIQRRRMGHMLTAQVDQIRIKKLSNPMKKYLHKQ